LPSNVSAKIDGRHKRGEQSRKKILRESLRLFAQYGYAGTSLSAIRDATGLPVTSLHHHFGSKAGLCLAAINGLGQSLTENDIREHMRGVTGPAARLDVLLTGIQRHYEKERAALELVIRLAVDADNIDREIRPAVHRIRALAKTDLATSLALAFADSTPPLTPQHLETLAARILVVLDGLLISRLTDPATRATPWPLKDIATMALAFAGVESMT